ncbi:MAG: DUF1329 domain-containing protein [Gammaproteobacteria bacterium]|nr:DUF1329 domain-containing protein [Gammaproteobacteria bacterium]
MSIMKWLLICFIVVFSLAPPLLLAEVQEGTILNAANLNELSNQSFDRTPIDEMLTPNMRILIEKYGLQIKMGRPVHISPSADVQANTEAHSGKVEYDPATRMISGYVSGIPFPNLEDDDPDLPQKLVWNHFYGHRLNADFFLASTSMYIIDGNKGVQRNNTFINNFLRMKYRNSLMPATLGSGEVKEKIMAINIAPYDVAGTGALIQRYDDGRKDDAWAYIKSVRRIRRVSGDTWMDPIAGTDLLNDDNPYCLGIFPTWYPEFRYVGRQRVFMVTSQAAYVKPGVTVDDVLDLDEPPYWNPSTETVWEPREVYVIDGIAPDVHPYGRKRLYYDPEMSGFHMCDMYDRKGDLWKTMIAASRNTTMPDGNEATMVGWNLVVDFQREHASTAVTNYTRGNDDRVPPSNWSEEMMKRTQEFSIQSNIQKYGPSL